MTKSELVDQVANRAELTKQRTAMKQQLDRAVPQINAQIRALSQQQSALRRAFAAGGARRRNLRRGRRDGNALRRQVV